MKTHYTQSNFLSGVLDPRASARIETQAYNNGMLVGDNITPIHLGGVIRRGGLRYVTTLPNKLTGVAYVSVTAPNGGDTSHMNDVDPHRTIQPVPPRGSSA